MLVPSELDRLGKIDHFCFGGRRDFREPLRVLIAGGGTGDALIFLGEQLRETPAELVYLDLSAASQEIARRRAEVRGLENVTWVQGSILELPALELGAFDYINCVGVLHHLEDPAAGLRRLAGSLAEGGGMGLMLYGKYGRRRAYLLQEAMSLVNSGESDLAAKVETTRRALIDLTEHGVIAGSAAAVRQYTAPENAAAFIDTYLHGQDRPFTVAEIHELLEDCELHLGGFTNYFDKDGAVCPLDYEPTLYFTDPELLARIQNLSPAARGQLAEILCGSISMHAFYATHEANVTPSVGDLAMTPYFLTSYGESVAFNITSRSLEEIEIRLQGGRTKSLRLDELQRRVLERIDGKRTTEEICKELLDSSRKCPPEDLVRCAMSLLSLLNELGLVFLRRGDLPPLPVQEVGRRWNGSIDLRGYRAR